jgi:hypothetical protein
VIAGYNVDASNVSHGFVRTPDGWITTFDAPGTGASAYQGTYPYGLNQEGAITGWCIDASNVNHGFLRLP